MFKVLKLHVNRYECSIGKKLCVEKTFLFDFFPAPSRQRPWYLHNDWILFGRNFCYINLYLNGSKTFLPVPDVCGGHIFGAKLAGSETSDAGKHERGLPYSGRRVVTRNMATRLFLQERKKSHVPRDEHTESLLVAVSRQDAAVHVQVRAVDDGIVWEGRVVQIS